MSGNADRSVRDPLRAGASAVLVLVIMLGGSLVLWIGVPLAWLYVGGQVKGSSDSTASAVGVMMIGAPLTVILLARVLAWLNHKYVQLSTPRARPGPQSKGPLEAVMLVSAVVAVVVFVFWFLVIAGPGPSLAPQN